MLHLVAPTNAAIGGKIRVSGTQASFDRVPNDGFDADIVKAI
jgi:hypothetical protein